MPDSDFTDVVQTYFLPLEFSPADAGWYLAVVAQVGNLQLFQVLRGDLKGPLVEFVTLPLGPDFPEGLSYFQNFQSICHRSGPEQDL